MFSRIVTAASFAVVAAAAFATIPAAAAVASTCATVPTQLRSAAATATPDAQRKALTLINTGERLCEADATFEAKKKFAAAAHTLGIDVAALPTATASAQ